MRLGIYGGSFDPVHFGHLLLAECCREGAELDEVWFLPAAQPPHKRGRVLTEGRVRREMLELAIAGHPQFRVSTAELDRGGVSYTVETLATIREMRGGDALFFLLGADSLSDLPSWYRPSEIVRLATLLVVRRGGMPEPDFSVLSPLLPAERIEQLRESCVGMPAMELSSSDVRARVQSGHSIRYRVPRAVEKYIQTHGVYQPAGASSVMAAENT